MKQSWLCNMEMAEKRLPYLEQGSQKMRLQVMDACRNLEANCPEKVISLTFLLYL